MNNHDYKASFDALKYDMATIVAMLGFQTYPGIDPVLRRLSELLLSYELAVDARGVQASSHPALIALDKQCRDDVARALGLTPTADRGFAWSLLLDRVKGIKADLAAAPKDYVPLNEALQAACGKLPEGWRIELHIERDGGGVELYNAQGVEVDFPSDHGRLDYTVNDALEAALAGGEA
ncbi:hypothetical protein [Ectopseudomonas alcaliphila]|uniref:Uncharacterized protein n=1 Tax=Ectopseudomonas alcaliphila TaxID=101564 RepID=A0A1G7MNH0_9GAMM|nr:hypothetical protein [Pseudomonas alcaliphila]MDX5994926.1 hypothetical protein [Pseudomonas alcaliphila]SDF63325.1 hypothetical protein SAMN05216575_10993 [Pseudomonas alcaliphila]